MPLTFGGGGGAGSGSSSPTASEIVASGVTPAELGAASAIPPYDQAVLALSPLVYMPLSDTEASAGTDDGAPVSLGSFTLTNSIGQNVGYGISPGPIVTDPTQTALQSYGDTGSQVGGDGVVGIGTTDCSMMIWANPTISVFDVDTTGQETPVNFAYGTPQQSGAGLALDCQATVADSNGHRSVISFPSLTVGDWHLFVLVVSRTDNTVSLYVDNELVATNDVTFTGSLDPEFSITELCEAEGFFTNCQMAKAAILPSALTVAQINVLWEAAMGTATTPTTINGGTP